MRCSNKMTTEAYDVIIIGSGMAGLYTGIQLQKRGRRILMLEKDTVLGGRASTFKQKVEGVDLHPPPQVLLDLSVYVLVVEPFWVSTILLHTLLSLLAFWQR